jgi:hypothetical protein
MGSCAWLSMPRNTHRSDALTERLHIVECDTDSVPLSAFNLFELLVHHVQGLDQRITELEQGSVPDAIPLPASLFEEAFADDEEAGENA